MRGGGCGWALCVLGGGAASQLLLLLQALRQACLFGALRHTLCCE